MRFFFTELSLANTYFVLLSEGNRRVEAVLIQLIFILALILTLCLIFFLYFLCIKKFVRLKPKEQNIMWSSNISEAMWAAKSVCLTADDRFRRMLTIRMKQCAGVTVDYEQNPFFVFLLSAESMVSFSWRPFFVELWLDKEQQAMLTLKGFSFTSINKTRIQWWFHKLQKFSVDLFRNLDWNTENRQIAGTTQLCDKLQWAISVCFVRLTLEMGLPQVLLENYSANWHSF